MSNQEQAMPVLRFPEFNEKWKCMPIKKWLKKVIDYRGKPPPKADEGVSLITARNVKMGYLDFEAAEYIDANQYEGWMNRGLPKSGDVMFTTEAPLGNVARFPKEGKFALGQRIITLQSLPENCDNGFLFQALLAPKMQYEIQSRGTGSTAKGIKSKLFVKIPLSAPDIKEQQKIAAFLGAVDEKIAQLQKKKDLLQDYKKGCMQKLFSQQIRFTDDNCNPFPDWEKINLGRLVTLSAGTSKSKHISNDGERYIIDMGSVSTSGQLIPSKKTNYNGDLLKSGQLVMPKDDIGGGRIIGRVGLIDQDNKYVLGDHVYLLSNIKCNSLFLSYKINSYEINKSFRRKANGTAQLGLARNSVLKQEVKIPQHPGEQKKIADFLSAIDDKIALVAEEVDKVKTFKKGLLQQMFV